MFVNMFAGYDLMWKIAAIVILWMGVFAAMNDSIANGVVSTIKSGAESTGKFALKALRYAPVFPVKIDRNGDNDTNDKGEQMANFADLANMAKLPGQFFDSKEKESRDDVRKHAKSVFNIDLDGGTTNLREFEATSKTNPNVMKNALEKVTQGDSKLDRAERKRILDHLVTNGFMTQPNADLMIKMDEDKFRDALKNPNYVNSKDLNKGNYQYKAKNNDEQKEKLVKIESPKAKATVEQRLIGGEANDKIEAIKVSTDNNEKEKNQLAVEIAIANSVDGLQPDADSQIVLED